MEELTAGCESIDPESSDWYHAVTLAERIDSLRRHESLKIESPNEVIRRRLERWYSQYPHTRDNYFSQCLVTHKISKGDFLYILGEPIEDVRDRLVTSPSWLRSLTSAFSRAASSSPISFKEISRGNETILFLNLVEPLIRQARNRLREGVDSLTQELSTPFIAAEFVDDALLPNLTRHLLQILSPTLVLELNVARLQGLLKGDTCEDRFQSFVARLRQPDIALAILREYPTLARQVVICLDNWVTSSLEFLGRLSADWRDLRAHFCAAENPGVLVLVDDSKGDQHGHGRSVLILTFSSGFQVVYKPRPLAVAVHFQELLHWLNDRGAEPPLRTLKVLDRGTYGWVEFVSTQGCTSRDEVRRFYERQGEYLALLYVLEATDFHYENLIAAGEHPVLVDLETLFQPYIDGKDFRDGGQRTSTFYRNSVLRVGLLPQRLFASAQDDGIDWSGLGAAAGQPLPYPVFQFEAIGTDEMKLIQKQRESIGGVNQPTLNGAKIDVLDYADSIGAGFATMYQLLLQCRDKLSSADGPLARFAGDKVRIILRPTLTYALLLRSGFHPDALRDALDRDVMFDSLWVNTQHHPHLAKIFPSEREDLNNRDIPIFTTYPSSYDVSNSSGQTIPNVFSETGMSLVHRRLRSLSETDYQQQLWFVYASLATMAMGRDRARWPTYHPRKQQTKANHRQLLAAAEAVGDRLNSLALHSEEGVSWIGLTLTAKDRWSLVPLGVDLYGGLPGVALFLAYLGTISNETRYTRLARAALKTIQRHLAGHSLYRLSIGAFDGLGGIVFLLTHLGVVWNEPELLLEANRIAGSLNALIAYDRKFDIISGSAGCIMSLLTLHRIAPSENTLATAIKCGDHLLEHAQPLQNSMAWPPYFPAKGPLTGLAHGASGIAWALLELAELSGEKRFSKVALQAFKYEEALFVPERRNWPDLREMDERSQPDDGDGMFMAGWCHGAPGITLTRLRSLKYVDNAQIRNEIEAGLDTTLNQGFSGNHSLCHGDLGNLEPLLQASEVLDQTQWLAHVKRLTAAILGSIHDYGWFCGLPLGVESPGLMTGLAGIGYGLLRVAEPSRIPAILVLAPPISPKTRGLLSSRSISRGL